MSTPSLGELIERLSAREHELQEKESSREVYLAIWKTLPYFLVSLVALTISMFVYAQLLVWMGIVACCVVIEIGWGCWRMTIRRDNDIASLKSEIRDLTEETKERRRYVRNAFIRYLVNIRGRESRLEHLMFNFDHEEPSHFDFKNDFSAQRVEDMRFVDSRIVEKMAQADQVFNEFEELRCRFNNGATGALGKLELTHVKSLRSRNQPKSSIEATLVAVDSIGASVNKRSSLLVLSKEIEGIPDSEETKKRVRHIHGLEEFLALIFSEETMLNPYPSLLQKDELAQIAHEVRGRSIKYNELRREIEETIHYRYGLDYGVIGETDLSKLGSTP